MKLSWLITLLIALPATLAPIEPASAQLFPLQQNAQNNYDLVITWKADSLVPAWYEGVSLPSQGSLITAAVQALADGQLVSLADKTVAWRINDIPAKTSVGGSKISFRVGQSAGFFDVITATILENGQQVARSSVTIPIESPKIVVSVPYPNKILPRANALAEALFYFFNVRSLQDFDISWNINDIQIPRESTLGSIVAASFDNSAQYLPIAVYARLNQQGAEAVVGRVIASVK